MKKIISLVVVLCAICGVFLFSTLSYAKPETKAEIKKADDYASIKDDLWCVTFQLVWNDFMDKYTKGKPVQFVGGNPLIADKLNQRLYTSEILDKKSYYKTQGKVSQSLKKNIEKGIYKKFHEKSDILDMINWNVKDSYLFYVMLIKNFTFKQAFDEWTPSKFYGSKENVKFFGIKSSSNKKLRDNVQVLFYKNDEYAVKLLTKENEEVILYRTDKKASFEEHFEYVSKNSNPDIFKSDDIIMIPNLHVDETISYNELSNKRIEGTDKMISQALQTIKFEMDNKGGRLKSEAAITVMKTSLMPVEKRYFLFNKPFVLFLKEEGKDKPYYAMVVNDTKYLVKQ